MRNIIIPLIMMLFDNFEAIYVTNSFVLICLKSQINEKFFDIKNFTNLD